MGGRKLSVLWGIEKYRIGWSNSEKFPSVLYCQKKTFDGFQFFFSANYYIGVLQLHLLLCRKIPLSCPYSCGISIPREMVHAFYHSLSDVIDVRVGTSE